MGVDDIEFEISLLKALLATQSDQMMLGITGCGGRPGAPRPRVHRPGVSRPEVLRHMDSKLFYVFIS